MYSLLVLETNADSINGNVYTWKFDRNNYRKNIYLKASSFKKNSSEGKTPSNPGSCSIISNPATKNSIYNL